MTWPPAAQHRAGSAASAAETSPAGPGRADAGDGGPGDPTPAGAASERRRKRLVLLVTGALLAAAAVTLALWAWGWHQRGWIGMGFHGHFDVVEDELLIPSSGPFSIFSPVSGKILQVGPGSPAARAGVRVGDVVVAVEGIPLSAEPERFEQLAGRLRRGDEVTYVVGGERGPRTLRLRLAGPFANPAVLLQLATDLAVALVFLSLAFLVAWTRPRSAAARVFYFFSVVGAAFFFVQTLSVLDLQSGRGLVPMMSGFDRQAALWIAFVLLIQVLNSALLHLVLVFPRRQPLVDRIPVLVPWIYALPFVSLATGLLLGVLEPGEHAGALLAAGLVMLLAGGALVARHLRRRGRHELARIDFLPTLLVVAGAAVAGIGAAALTGSRPLLLGVVLAFLGLGLLAAFGYWVLVLVALVASYRRSGVEEQRQIRWPLWGIATAVVGTLLCTAATYAVLLLAPALFAENWVNITLTMATKLCYVLVPVSFAVGIAKYRVMEIDFLLRKTAVYAGMTGFVVAGYVVLVGVFGVLVVSLTGVENQTVTIVATLAIALLFVPVRSRVQALVDRRFARDATDRRAALDALRGTVVAAADLPGLAERFAAIVQQALQSRSAAVFVPRADGDGLEGGSLVAAGKVGLPDEVTGRLEVDRGALAAEGRAVAELAATTLAPADRAQLERRGLALLAPARRHGAVAALLAVGRKLDRTAYTGEELDFLAAAADQLALAVGALGPRREAAELRQARDLQRRLLPAALPQPAGGWQLAARWEPAREVAGDYYDVLSLRGGKLALCIGDVAGKGMTAALLMSSLQAAVRAVADAAASPGRVCEQVRRVLTPSLAGGRFVTFFYAVLDPATGRLAYTNAGHVPPVLVRADGRVERLEAGGGALARLLAGTSFSDQATHLAPGDRLVLVTDGVTEAQDGSGELFGEERLLELLRGHHHLPATALEELLVSTLRSYTVGEPGDDLTLLILAAD